MGSYFAYNFVKINRDGDNRFVGPLPGGECMKKSSRLTGLALTLIGAMVLLNNLGKPRVEALHGPDILGLVASGMLFGIGFAGLMGILSFPSSTKDQS